MTSINPEPTRTPAPTQAPATGTPSSVYPEEGVAPPPEQGTAPATSAPPAATQPPVQRTRAASFWVSVVVTALLFIALIIFLAQNSHQISIHFLGWSGHVSEAVALLIAAVCGALLVAIPASIRIVQLRHGAKKAARQQ
jgi:uncharacterized integral membrane protein